MTQIAWRSALGALVTTALLMTGCQDLPESADDIDVMDDIEGAVGEQGTPEPGDPAWMIGAWREITPQGSSTLDGDAEADIRFQADGRMEAHGLPFDDATHFRTSRGESGEGLEIQIQNAVGDVLAEGEVVREGPDRMGLSLEDEGALELRRQMEFEAPSER